MYRMVVRVGATGWLGACRTCSRSLWCTPLIAASVAYLLAITATGRYGMPHCRLIHHGIEGGKAGRVGLIARSSSQFHQLVLRVVFGPRMVLSPSRLLSARPIAFEKRKSEQTRILEIGEVSNRSQIDLKRGQKSLSIENRGP